MYVCVYIATKLLVNFGFLGQLRHSGVRRVHCRGDKICDTVDTKHSLHFEFLY